MRKATVDDVNRMRDIALKFFKGHNAEYREGYRGEGLVDELEELRYLIAATLESKCESP